MFTMGPKTQRNLFFSSKTIEKSILATPPVSLLYKKTCRWIADWALWPAGKDPSQSTCNGSDDQSINLRHRNSIGLPYGEKCSRWIRRHNGISLSPARLLKKYTGDAASIPFKKKRIAGLLIESCGQLGKSQPIHVQWIRRPDYNNNKQRQ